MQAAPITERRTKIFDNFDENKDGKVDYSEMKTGQYKIGRFEDSVKTEELIKKIDTNNDNMIELWELLQADFTPEPSTT